MPRSMYDFGTELRASSAPAITASGNTSALAVPGLTRILTSSWNLSVSACAASGTYRLALEAALTQAGSWTEIAALQWDPTKTGNVQVPVGQSVTNHIDPRLSWVRMVWTLGGASPSLMVASWISKTVDKVGTGSRARDDVQVL